ncbi:hypothetical protein [Flavobacterium sp. KACC 22761]|uniref:hypothetical protein n=1 Tax=Flavobacterium sp. KACC 22761 TaxID=3092665 RepID=UPI002A74BE08|nr:hypothetical protein [Flavobacterium sp. KACC 22761]WPO80744.1 hypothetical protein SCB73_10200 [Flavobacterium sp. KACC 22761]
MEKSMNNFKIGIVLLVSFCISCSKKSEIESTFRTSENEYWKYKNYCLGTKGIYFQFKEDGSYDKYLLYIDEGFSRFNTDMGGGIDRRVWSIKDDSTFVFDNAEYHIEKISKEEVLLSYYHYKIKDKKCFISLKKLVDGPRGPKSLDSVKVK